MKFKTCNVRCRIYSKFHKRRIQELSEVGLYNLTSLFITIGMTADLEDVVRSTQIASIFMIPVVCSGFLFEIFEIQLIKLMSANGTNQY